MAVAFGFDLPCSQFSPSLPPARTAERTGPATDAGPRARRGRRSRPARACAPRSPPFRVPRPAGTGSRPSAPRHRLARIEQLRHERVSRLDREMPTDQGTRCRDGIKTVIRQDLELRRSAEPSRTGVSSRICTRGPNAANNEDLVDIQLLHDTLGDVPKRCAPHVFDGSPPTCIPSSRRDRPENVTSAITSSAPPAVWISTVKNGSSLLARSTTILTLQAGKGSPRMQLAYKVR